MHSVTTPGDRIFGRTEVLPYKIWSSLRLFKSWLYRSSGGTMNIVTNGLQSVVRGSEVKMSSVGTAHMYS